MCQSLGAARFTEVQTGKEPRFPGGVRQSQAAAPAAPRATALGTHPIRCFRPSRSSEAKQRTDSERVKLGLCEA
jgi:hypothetical protein